MQSLERGFMILHALILVRFLQTSAYMCLFFFFLIRFKEQRKRRIALTVAIYAITTVAVFISLFTFGQTVVERLFIPILVALCLILIKICSADKWSVSLFVMFTQFNLYLGISYVSDVGIPATTGLPYSIQYLTARTVLFGALLYYVLKYVRPYFRRLVEALDKEWNVMSLLAFSFFLLESITLYYPDVYWYEADYRWHLVGSSYLLFFSAYWLIFRSIRAVVEKYEIRERERILAQQNKMWEEQIEEQNHAINVARRDRHDLRHHYDTLLAMLSSGKIDETISYLNNQASYMDEEMFTTVCSHTAANAILSRWIVRAKDYGIRTDIDARIPVDIPMDDVALVGIIANAIENAVEGCLRCPIEVERFISVKAAYSLNHGAGKFHLVVENSCVDTIVFEDGFPQSQKINGGTGTKSMSYTAEKYNGMVEFNAENGIFRMRVLLHLGGLNKEKGI